MSDINPKVIYQRNMVQLTSDLRVDDSLMSEMIGAGVFTQANGEEVMGEREKGNNRKFINILNGRGLRGFNAFIKALVKTLQDDLADSLHKQKAEEARRTLGLDGQSVQANTVFQFEKDQYIGIMGEAVATVVRDCSEGDVTIEYSTGHGSAKGGDVLQSGVDYISKQGTLTFKQGELSKDIIIEVNEQITKPKEFTITLRNPSNGAKIGEHCSTSVTINVEEGQLVFEVKPIDRNEAERILARQHVYRLEHNPRGRVMILNNQGFDECTELEKRGNSGFDVTNLQTLFKQLHFQCAKTEEDRTAQMMKTIIQRESQRDHSSYDAFFLIVMSHGTKGYVYGTDGKMVNIEEDIIKPLKMAKGLKDKPKVLLFQACRGEKKEKQVTPSPCKDVPAVKTQYTANQNVITTPSSDTATDAVPGTYGHQPMDTNEQSTAEVDPGNMLIVSSAVPGQTAYNEELGSWFIREFVKVTAKYACEKHLLDILADVGHRVKNKTADEHIDGASHGKQSCQIDNRGFDEFHFLPGYVKK